LHPAVAAGSGLDCPGFRGLMAKTLKVQNPYPDPNESIKNMLLINISRILDGS
jgi:hypothetical protein